MAPAGFGGKRVSDTLSCGRVVLLLLLASSSIHTATAFSFSGLSYFIFGSDEQGSWDVCANTDEEVQCSCETDLLLTRNQPLDCTHRNIGFLHDGMVIPKRFAGVDFSDNKMINMTQDTFHSGNNTHLTSLDLSANQITLLHPYTFANLPNLTTLDLSNNRIRQLHDQSLQGLSKLKRLNLGYNKLQVLPEDLLTGCSELEELAIPYNAITSLPDTLFKGLGQLKHLDLSYLRLASLHATVFRELRLEKLELIHNNLDLVPTKALYALSSTLKTLDLSGNTFKVLGAYAIYNLRHLTELRLEQMVKLQSIEAYAFTELPSLHTVVLRYLPKINFLDTLAFSSNKNGTDIVSPIRDFTLSFTMLHQLPQGLLDWSGLNYLNLHNNRWNCDCNLKWIKNSSIERLIGDQFYCSSPTRVRGASLSMLKAEDFTCLATDTFNDSWQWGTLLLIFVMGVLASLLTVAVLFHRRHGYLITPPRDYTQLHSTQSRESMTVVDTSAVAPVPVRIIDDEAIPT